MNPDYNKAAILAAETLVKFNVRSAPVSPLPILEQMNNVIVISFTEISDISGVKRSDIIPLFGSSRDAVTSIHIENGRSVYVVAYNGILPFNIVQRALAREMAHIVMKHEDASDSNIEEASCFAQHLLCPRPLIHAIQATGLRLTTDLLINLTGACEQSIVFMRHLPGAEVPYNLNRFVRSQFMPFFTNFFDYYQSAMPKDGSAIVDLGTFMDNYEE